MKKLYVLLSFLFLSTTINAQNPDAFIMTFEVTNDTGLNIKVPIHYSSNNNFSVDFGDGTILTNQISYVDYTYSLPGTYTVTVTGTFNRVRFVDELNPNSNNPQKIKTIEQWGSTQWSSMQDAFRNCSNLIINATDVPDLSQVVSMNYMFYNASSFNQPINNWDVSNVTMMRSMFQGASSFNQPLNNWDVSNVGNMQSMFEDATSFNQPLNNWDVSNVTNLSETFYNATSFNQNLGGWNFNTNVGFSWYTRLDGFLSKSGLNTTNFDLFLQRLVQLGFNNLYDWTVNFYAYDLEYCDIDTYNALGWNLVGASLSENCTNNSIVGKILFDEDNNGCDINNLINNSLFVTISNGSLDYSTLSVNGEYILNHLEEDNYTVSLTNVPSYITVSPQSSTVFLEGVYNEEEINFCLTANQIIQDLNIALLPISEARPGFEADYQLIVQNIGTQTMNNVLVILTFDDTMQSFVSANPTESSATTNQLNFEIASLSPFSSSVIDFTMQTFTPPTVNGDDILNFTATVTPNTDDYTPNDNTFELAQIVVNSYDPNDKLILQGSKIYIDDVNEYLHYIVRFQNTGTASAIHVRIEDTLHQSLDWNTIQILNSSHNYRVEIKDGNQMEFIFNNINLPYEDEDEEGSNGFIAYKIKPIAGTQIGDFIIGNEAYIYFDYNEPIITNTTSTEVVEENSSVSVHNLNDLISVYPNPTNGVLYISSKGNTILEGVKIYNLQGRELFGSTTNQETINIENLSAGIYLMNIRTNQGVISKRVIKK